MLVCNKCDLHHMRAVPTEEATGCAGTHMYIGREREEEKRGSVKVKEPV